MQRKIDRVLLSFVGSAKRSAGDSPCWVSQQQSDRRPARRQALCRQVSSSSLMGTEVKEETTIVCDPEPAEIPAAEVTFTIRKEDVEPESLFVCSTCDYKTKLKSNFSRHLMQHSGIKPYTCGVCPYRTSISSNLARHTMVHRGEKPYACDVCNYRTCISSNLDRHMRIHVGELPYICTLCEYSTNVSSNLSRHMKAHTHEKPYACDLCSYKATTSSNLKRHRLGHRKELFKQDSADSELDNLRQDLSPERVWDI